MTKTISKNAIERARAFVSANARSLDQAYLACVLPGNARAGAVDRLIAALSKFQTSEGGFAHGIESDLRTPAPQAISTSVALQFLRGIDAKASLPMVKSAITYLIGSVDRKSWVWPAIDARVDEAPHAPWWNTQDLEQRFGGFVFNPSAELLGYLYDYRVHVPDDVLKGVEARVLDTVQNTEIIKNAYDLHCCMRLLHTRALPAHARNVLEARIPASLEAADPDDLHLDLMGMVPTPSSFGYNVVRAKIIRQAERLIASQADDGGWHPFWNWSEVDADAWRNAEREWSGVLTRQAIVNLSRHEFVVAE